LENDGSQDVEHRAGTNRIRSIARLGHPNTTRGFCVQVLASFRTTISPVVSLYRPTWSRGEGRTCDCRHFRHAVNRFEIQLLSEKRVNPQPISPSLSGLESSREEGRDHRMRPQLWWNWRQRRRLLPFIVPLRCRGCGLLLNSSDVQTQAYKAQRLSYFANGVGMDRSSATPSIDHILC